MNKVRSACEYCQSSEEGSSSGESFLWGTTGSVSLSATSAVLSATLDDFDLPIPRFDFTP